jgi:hypothetical protein
LGLSDPIGASIILIHENLIKAIFVATRFRLSLVPFIDALCVRRMEERMEYRVTDDATLITRLGVVQSKILVDYDEVGRALQRITRAAQYHVVHEDDFPDGPNAPTSARFGELYPAGLREVELGVEYPARPTCPEHPEGDPAWLDWGAVRIGSVNYALEDRRTARAILVECLEQGIDPEDMVKALTSAAVQIERYARRWGHGSA